jgi:hypothetical protein
VITTPPRSFRRRTRTHYSFWVWLFSSLILINGIYLSGLFLWETINRFTGWNSIYVLVLYPSPVILFGLVDLIVFLVYLFTRHPHGFRESIIYVVLIPVVWFLLMFTIDKLSDKFENPIPPFYLAVLIDGTLYYFVRMFSEKVR